jgi:hypothetical protein
MATTKPNPRAVGFSGYAPFITDTKEPYGSFEVFWQETNIGLERPLQQGWYWWACFPGCIPDGEPSGPFNTSREAYDDARNT